MSSRLDLRDRHGAFRPPEDQDQYIVETPYGRGLSVRTRKLDDHGNEMREIKLLEWDTLTKGQPKQQPTLYSVIDFPSVKPMVGDDVVCMYGRGRIVSIMNDMCVVKLSSWRLAGRSLVTCHLSLDSVKVVRKKTLREMNAYEKVDYAQEKKALATKYFTEKQYEQALTNYAAAVDAIRYVQHDANSNNELRADLLVVMITCCNNAATCSVQLSKWDEAINFTKNALVLVDALYNKRGMKIHSILNKEGYSDAKIFGEWRVKSYLVMGGAQSEKGDYTLALDNLKLAQDIAMSYMQSDKTDAASVKNLQSQEKTIKRLLSTCIQQKKAEKKKEKERAMAMFGNGSPNKLKEPAPLPSAPLPSSPLSVLEMKEKADDLSSQQQDDELEELPPALAPPVEATRTEPVKDKPRTVKKKVSFSEVNEEREIEEYEDEELPWYDEHKEALILTAVTGFAALWIMLLGRSRK